MLACENLLSLVGESLAAEQALDGWKHQSLVDASLKVGLDSQESAEIPAARGCLRALGKTQTGEARFCVV